MSRTRTGVSQVTYVQGQLSVVDRLMRGLEQLVLPDGRTVAIVTDELMDWLAAIGAHLEDFEHDEREPTA